MLGLSDLKRHVAQVLEVELMMPRHLGAATLCILALAVLQVVVLIDVSPEVVALHIGCINRWVLGIAVAALGKVPAVELLARCRHIDEVAWC